MRVYVAGTDKVAQRLRNAIADPRAPSDDVHSMLETMARMDRGKKYAPCDVTCLRRCLFLYNLCTLFLSLVGNGAYVANITASFISP
jgi:hypothetical protein